MKRREKREKRRETEDFCSVNKNQPLFIIPHSSFIIRLREAQTLFHVKH